MLKYVPATKWASGAKSLLGTIARGGIAYTGTETASKIGENIVTPKTVEARDDTLSEVGTDIGITTAIGVGADTLLPPAVKFGSKVLSPVVNLWLKALEKEQTKLLKQQVLG